MSIFEAGQCIPKPGIPYSHRAIVKIRSAASILVRSIAIARSRAGGGLTGNAIPSNSAPSSIQVIDRATPHLDTLPPGKMMVERDDHPRPECRFH